MSRETAAGCEGKHDGPSRRWGVTNLKREALRASVGVCPPFPSLASRHHHHHHVRPLTPPLFNSISSRRRSNGRPVSPGANHSSLRRSLACSDSIFHSLQVDTFVTRQNLSLINPSGGIFFKRIPPTSQFHFLNVLSQFNATSLRENKWRKSCSEVNEYAGSNERSKNRNSLQKK